MPQHEAGVLKFPFSCSIFFAFSLDSSFGTSALDHFVCCTDVQLHNWLQFCVDFNLFPLFLEDSTINKN